MAIEKITIQQARKLLLAAQGLDRPPERPAQKSDVLAAVRRMGVLQIDTIHVIARSPYLVLWSRLGDYRCEWLDELLAEGALFEYWAHAACFLPVEDFPLYRRYMLNGAHLWMEAPRWLEEHRAAAGLVLGRIRAEGGLRSADFASDHRPRNGWWDWKDEKTALECLIITGDLMVARREKFQRVYDLRERVLPGWEDGPDTANVPTLEDVQREQTLRAVKHLGVARADWVADYYRLPKRGIVRRLDALADEGLLRRVEMEGLGQAYLHPDAVIPERVEGTLPLSPFDPVVWDRRRLKELFGFTYQIETYTPKQKRAFGYFTLPILHDGEMVGRLDPKAHRAEGVFEVRAVALEPGVSVTDELAAGLAQTLRRMAAWHGTPEVVVRRTEPAGLGERMAFPK